MNVTFIGMSGAGKSYIGKLFAEQYGFEFIDIDVVMEQLYQKPLQVILSELGEPRFLEEQSEQVISLGALRDTVISPGGSVVYSPEAIDFLKKQSVLVYLAVPRAVVEARITADSRGIVGLGRKTFAQLYAEREVLYKEAADVTAHPTGKDVTTVLEFIYRACVLK
jgi:shikimate kinase